METSQRLFLGFPFFLKKRGCKFISMVAKRQRPLGRNLAAQPQSDPFFFKKKGEATATAPTLAVTPKGLFSLLTPNIPWINPSEG